MGKIGQESGEDRSSHRAVFLSLRWGVTTADIQQRREERETREREEEAQKQREEARREETTHSAEEGVAEKHAKTDRSDAELDTCTEGGEEAGTSQSNSRHKKGHMTNIYLTDLDQEAIVDFVKDHEEELFNKTNEYFKDKARKECLWERFANSCKLSVKVCKTLFESQRTCYSKLTQSKPGQVSKEIKERQNWMQDKFNFLKKHIRCKGLIRFQVPGPRSQCNNCFSTQHLQSFNRHG